MTGSVTDTGDGVSHMVPIYESSCSAVAPSSVGRGPAEYATKNLTEQGYSLTAAAEREFAWNVKEKLCFMLPITTPCSHRPAEND